MKDPQRVGTRIFTIPNDPLSEWVDFTPKGEWTVMLSMGLSSCCERKTWGSGAERYELPKVN